MCPGVFGHVVLAAVARRTLLAFAVITGFLHRVHVSAPETRTTWMCCPVVFPQTVLPGMALWTLFALAVVIVSLRRMHVFALGAHPALMF